MMFRPVGRSAPPPDDLPADDEAADVVTLAFCIGMILVALLVSCQFPPSLPRLLEFERTSYCSSIVSCHFPSRLVSSRGAWS